ncbi:MULTISPECIES: DUF6125 family protein [unclassified Pseudodesulfovibrio]|uniref:DUF6125 family protein n=1 Tax=unclassified Pseudodesulfovibrio TaxID=2661612 RepID=UPI000FEC1FF1|nr:MULTISPECIES: DUF6125 family protein [unclassified Pseudodesulfovibrio]MCJ2165221.1 DUF6125 family protein [Pseudodesulfovibrio sp. S3-i]RWU03275.1 cytosolic protein [Pseudodesulfovibrio sp. S3]
MADTHEEQAVVLAEIIRQLAAHYGLWLAETVHQLGLDAALDAEAVAGDRLVGILTGKLERTLGHEPGGLLADVDLEVLEQTAQALRTAWLAADGVWFQAVERQAGMDAAKRVNDTCWARFAPLEARRIKARLGLPDLGGIPALKAGLAARMYGHLNEWEFAEETIDSIVFRMTDCRVQTARKRRGLDDYPCKSGGTTEYTGFAREIDSRLRCECVACPPDPHPETFACAWRFSLADVE